MQQDLLGLHMQNFLL